MRILPRIAVANSELIVRDSKNQQLNIWALHESTAIQATVSRSLAARRSLLSVTLDKYLYSTTIPLVVENGVGQEPNDAQRPGWA